MNPEPKVAVRNYRFRKQVLQELHQNRYANNCWPLVYVLSNGRQKRAYIGETTDALTRMHTHLQHEQKSTLTTVHLITSEKFNKSATLDIEANLIRYMSGDGLFRLMNGNLGLANHNYFQKKEVYWSLFMAIWDELRAQGLAVHSLEHINNSDLFKYSPYKSLGREQQKSLAAVLRTLLDDHAHNVVIEGGAGTGKTILAVFLFKMLHSNLADFDFREFGEDEAVFVELVAEVRNKYPDPAMALVVPMASFRKTLKKIFSNISGLSGKMVVGPAETVNRKYDLLVVDEAHRLRKRKNLGTYFGAFDKVCTKLKLDKDTCSELDWILKQSGKSVLFYDEAQSIKPSDAAGSDFKELKKAKTTRVLKLKSQFRVTGGTDYTDFVDRLLHNTLPVETGLFYPDHYELMMCDSIGDLVAQVKQRDDECGLSRLIAGYSWEWKSKKDKTAFDIDIDGMKLRWNSTSQDWINAARSVEEVGCIHTTQGYDLNYAGIIFGNEITYNEETGRIEVVPEQYFDRNGRQGVSDTKELKQYIINIYKTILLRGIRGTYVYACDPALRRYLAQFIPAAHEKVPDLQYMPLDEVKPFVNCIPLYDLKAAAGTFGEYQHVSDIQWLPLPESLKSGRNVFACRVVGNSMNCVIPDGAVCMFRKYSGGSRNGKIVLVELTDRQDSDSGSCYTVKEYRSVKKYEADNQWQHEAIRLEPRSHDSSYEPIILEQDEGHLLKVVGTFEQVLYGE